MLLILSLVGGAYAFAGDWKFIEDISAEDSNNADGTPPTLDNIFRVDKGSNVAISAAPYSAAGTVTSVTGARFKIVTFPDCTGTQTANDGDSCGKTKQRNRIIGSANAVDVDGTIVEDILYGFVGVYVDSMSISGSPDAVMRVSVKTD